MKYKSQFAVVTCFRIFENSFICFFSLRNSQFHFGDILMALWQLSYFFIILFLKAARYYFWRIVFSGNGYQFWQLYYTDELIANEIAIPLLIHSNNIDCKTLITLLQFLACNLSLKKKLLQRHVIGLTSFGVDGVIQPIPILQSVAVGTIPVDLNNRNISFKRLYIVNGIHRSSRRLFRRSRPLGPLTFRYHRPQ